MIDASRLNPAKPFGANNSNGLLISIALIAATVAIFLFWVFFGDSVWEINWSFQLLPWLFATALVLLAPTFYLYYHKKLDIFHPLVHASWAYWFPSIVVGGLFIATDTIYPYPMSLLSDPISDLTWTCIYVMLGYGGLTFGYFLPIGKRVGEYTSRKLPRWDWEPSQVVLPAMVFFGLGLFFYVNSFLAGVVGYSLTDTTEVFSTVYYTLSFLGLEAGFLLAIFIFKSRNVKFEHILAFSIIILLLLSRMSLGGNRGSIVSIVILLAIAFVYSGRRITALTAMIFGVLGILALIGGMIYGTTFRNQKGNEDKVGVDKQIETIGRTLDVIASQDTGKVIYDGTMSLAERIDGITSLGVVVSSYERLAPYEASYDLEGNIVKDLLISLIPRFLWTNKPPTSDPRAYSDLYFNFNGNSYAITPIGDLLRNYGPVGVPIGMMIVGIFLRFTYSLLIDNQKVTIGRATAYFLFLVSLSYEGFYSLIFIYGGRILIIAFITFFIAEHLFINKTGNQMVGKWKR